MQTKEEINFIEFIHNDSLNSSIAKKST